MNFLNIFTFFALVYLQRSPQKRQKGKGACVQHNEKKDKEDHNVPSFKPNLIHLRISVLLSVFKVRQLFLYFVIIMGIFFPPLLHVAALLFDISIRSYRAGWVASEQRCALKTQSYFNLNITSDRLREHTSDNHIYSASLRFDSYISLITRLFGAIGLQVVE